MVRYNVLQVLLVLLIQLDSNSKFYFEEYAYTWWVYMYLDREPKDKILAWKGDPTDGYYKCFLEYKALSGEGKHHGLYRQMITSTKVKCWLFSQKPSPQYVQIGQFNKRCQQIHSSPSPQKHLFDALIDIFVSLIEEFRYPASRWPRQPLAVTINES